jgi:chaperonin GroES
VAAKKVVKKKKTAAKKSPAKKTKAPVKKAKAPTKKKVTAKKATLAPKKVVAMKAPMSKKIDVGGFLTPLDDRVIVQVSGSDRMTAGGLYIPDTVADTSGNLQGLVLSVGRGRRDKKGRVHPMDLKVGDKVLFSEYSGSKIKVQETDLLILRESDVLGVVG